MTSGKASNSVLIGIIADVSGSMRSAIGTSGADAVNRLEAFSDALKGTVARAAESVREAANERPDLNARLFAYGFGFGNPLARFMGDSGPDVRDLFAPGGSGKRTIEIKDLADNWEAHYENVRSMALKMFGATPMRRAFEVGRERLAAERSSPDETSILFVLSDGEPTDGKAADILPIAERIRKDGTTIVSCLVTDSDITEARRLYGQVQDGWPPEARLMFDCASELPAGTAFGDHFREHEWRIDEGAKLFAQVNQSQTLGEFLDVVLSPLKESDPAKAAVPAAAAPRRTAAKAADPPPPEPAELPPAPAAAPEGKALLLFVHGLGGDARASWGRLPDFLMADPAVAARFDVDFYTFPTSIFTLPFGAKAPKVQELAAGLRTFIEYSGHQRVSLVCHSLGGLIARRYLIEEVKNKRPLRVDHLALFAVPNNGAGLASVGEYVSWRHPQIRQLCKDADLIEFLSEDWFTFKVQEQVKMKFIVGTQDRVVDRFSVAGYWGNPDMETVVGKGHLDLVKPEQAEDLVVRIVKKLLAD